MTCYPGQHAVHTPLPGRLVVVRARGGQPAFGFYARDPDTGSYYTVGLMVLTLSGTQVSALTRFDPAVLPSFGLPPFLSN